MKSEAENYLLGKHYELCYRAYSNTSFSPEKRAKNIIKEFSELLENDLKELGDNPGNYREKFEERFTAWMSAKSNCLSSMITGPARFPVRRAQKANDREQSKYEELVHWREKYFKAVNRIPTKSPEEELQLAEQKFEELTNFQIECKEVNKLARKFKKMNRPELLALLLNDGYSRRVVERLDGAPGGYKIPGYVLTNNNAKIKNAEQKMKIMEARINRKETWEDIVFEGGRVTIEDDRVKIFHDEKPEKEVISEIKSSGFRWSPFWKCWCRKHTGNAIYTVKQLSFVKQ